MSKRGDRRPKLKILSAVEKLGMAGRTFEHTDLAGVDLSRANLQRTRFVGVSLHGCDFSFADLRGAVFIGCDLRAAVFHQTLLADNRFDNTWLVGARGLSARQQHYIRAHGGRFLSLAHDRPDSTARDESPVTPATTWRRRFALVALTVTTAAMTAAYFAKLLLVGD